ncbi:MAG: serine/threonine protein kinase, partial [Mycobacteriaceae bacterium]
ASPPSPAAPAAPVPAQPQTTPAQAPPASGARCSQQFGGPGYSASGNGVTTCAFAEQVRLSFYQAGSGTGYVDAYSPATGRSYTMYCSGYAPVTCTGGNNAVVYIY